MIELKKKKRRNFSFTTVISSRESYEWSLGVSSFFFLFFLFFYIQRYHLHDYPSIFPRSRVKTLIFPCHSGCSLRNTWFSNSGHNRFLSSNTRRISRQERFVSDTVLLPFVTRRFDERKGYSSLFLPSFFFFPLNSSLPRILSSLFSLVPFFFSLSFFLSTSRVFPSQWGCPMLRLHTMRAKFDVLFSPFDEDSKR